MNIIKRLWEAWNRYDEGDAEAALFQVLAPVEVTARQEDLYYKQWLATSMPLITTAGIGPCANLHIVYSHPKLKATKDGTQSLDAIIFHAMRCGMYHEGGLPENIELTDEELKFDMKGYIGLPKRLALGIMLAVVASPSNSILKFPRERIVKVHGTEFDANDQWGRRVALQAELEDAWKNSGQYVRVRPGAGRGE